MIRYGLVNGRVADTVAEVLDAGAGTPGYIIGV